MSRPARVSFQATGESILLLRQTHQRYHLRRAFATGPAFGARFAARMAVDDCQWCRAFRKTQCVGADRRCDALTPGRDTMTIGTDWATSRQFRHLRKLARL